MTIYKILEQLRQTSSRIEKEAILKKNIKNDVLKRVVFLALDPYTQFYQRKIPDYAPARKNQADSLDSVMDSLLTLSSRQITGHEAINYLTKLLSSLTFEDAQVLECIIRKDLDCGVQVSTANKIWEGLVQDYPCMLASGYDQKLVDKIDFPAIVQLKMDGMRFNAIVDVQQNNVEYRSRNGKEIYINNYQLDLSFMKMAVNIGISNVVFDGELIVVDEFGEPLDRKTGNGILNKGVKGTIKEEDKLGIRAILWDVIPTLYFRQGKCDVDYETRLATLVTAVYNLDDHLKHAVSIVETNFVNTAYQAKRTFERYYADGQEGIILKSRQGIWENKRSKDQIKYKGEEECDLLCVDWEEGTGKNKGKLGALVLESADGKIKVSVGTGLSDEQRKTFKKKDVVGKVIAVKYNARIKSKDREEDSLFLPVFIEIREDKDKADSSKTIK